MLVQPAYMPQLFDSAAWLVVAIWTLCWVAASSALVAVVLLLVARFARAGGSGRAGRA